MRRLAICLLALSCDGNSTVRAANHVYVSGYAPVITVASLDDGVLTAVGTAQAGVAPSFLAIAPSKKFLYALDETDLDGIFTYAIDDSGALAPLGHRLAGGMGAAHIAVHPSGRWIATAHYDSNAITIHEIAADGTVGVKTDEQGDCLAAHQTVFAGQGRFAFTCCLMSDAVGQFQFSDGKLIPRDPPRVPVAGNPRHLVLDPGEQHAYVLSELENLITTFDVQGGLLTNPRTISSLAPDGRKMDAAEILIHPSGRFLYASNRSDDSIGIFAIDAAGDLASAGWQRSGAEWVRGFALDPSGTFLLAANQMLNQVVVFRIDPATGTLTEASPPLMVPAGPAFVGVLPLP